MKQKELLAQIDQQRISDAISEAEKSCSGEIRVHIESSLRGKNLREFAERTFERLGLTKTAQRNGVLLFIAAQEQQFVILGDEGINNSVTPDFWDQIAVHLTEKFKAALYTEGIVEAIQSAGTHLCAIFPPHASDVDELPNEISFGTGEHEK